MIGGEILLFKVIETLFLQQFRKDCNGYYSATDDVTEPGFDDKQLKKPVSIEQLIFLLNDVMNIYREYYLLIVDKLTGQQKYKIVLNEMTTLLGNSRKMMSAIPKHFSPDKKVNNYIKQK